MDRAEKMDCRSNGEVIFIGATTEFQLRKGLTPTTCVDILILKKTAVKKFSVLK